MTQTENEQVKEPARIETLYEDADCVIKAVLVNDIEFYKIISVKLGNGIWRTHNHYTLEDNEKYDFEGIEMDIDEVIESDIDALEIDEFAQ